MCQSPVLTNNKTTATSNANHPNAKDFPEILAASCGIFHERFTRMSNVKDNSVPPEQNH